MCHQGAELHRKDLPGRFLVCVCVFFFIYQIKSTSRGEKSIPLALSKFDLWAPPIPYLHLERQELSGQIKGLGVKVRVKT